jgi:hypothetical protein
MVSTNRHVLHSFLGEEDGKALADWLNQKPPSGAQRQVASLINDLRELRRLSPHEKSFHDFETALKSDGGPHKEMRRTPIFSLTDKALVPSREFGRRLRAIDKQLARHKMRPRIVSGHAKVLNASTIKTLTAFRWEWYYGKNPATKAVHQLMRLEEQGLLERVRQCMCCGRWLFARFVHQKFCGQSCQLRSYKSSEDWKEHRRKWLKQHRAKARTSALGQAAKKRSEP